MTFPKQVKIVEVGPRDGLQNEPENVPTNTKIEFINKLSETGLQQIEVTSFVSSKRIPQLSDASEVYKGINKMDGVRYPVLVPNLKGLEDAIDSDVKEIAVFTAVSESFSKKNTNSSISESLDIIKSITDVTKPKGIPVRGYISCVLGCPYEGKISPDRVVEVASKLFDLGCYEISLGDTIGVGTALEAKRLVEMVSKKIPLKNIAVHFHDTYGQALANIYAVLELGITIIDSSIGGLGGCPYAKGATGNVATEDVLYMLKGMDIETNIDFNKLLEVSMFASDFLSKPTRSKVTLANQNK